jgi:hypothetical protein
MITALVLLLLAALGGNRRKFVADPAAEAFGCQQALAQRPLAWEGRTRPRGMSELEWLSRVAFRVAYGYWPTTAPAQVARLASLLVCVSRTTTGGA